MPESLEARVRALEQADAADRARLLILVERAERELFPLVEMYGRLDERFNAILKDVLAAHEAVRELSREVQDALDERNTQIAAVKHEAEGRAVELQARADQARIESRRMAYGLIGIFITSAAGVLTAILAAGGPH
jgi:hypothetical protein